MSIPLTELSFTAPVRLVSEANRREHWAVQRRRKIEQQQHVALAFFAALKGRRLHVSMPCLVTLTRVGAKTLDSDNLANSFKAVQDAIAQKLGVDDGDVSRVRWVYEQRATGRHEYSLEVRIVSVT